MDPTGDDVGEYCCICLIFNTYHETNGCWVDSVRHKEQCVQVNTGTHRRTHATRHVVEALLAATGC